MTYCIRLMLSETKLWRKSDLLTIIIINFLFISPSYWTQLIGNNTRKKISHCMEHEFWRSHLLLQITVVPLFWSYSLMSFVANELKWPGTNLWLYDCGKTVDAAPQTTFPNMTINSHVSHLDIGHPVFVLMYRKVGLCYCGGERK